jgi:hypothetical protein
MATPILKKEYLDMIPDFSGEPTLLNRFISICDKLVAKFYVSNNVDDFQNEYLFSTILSKIRSPAIEIVTSSNSYAWPDVRQILLTSYLDKRDCYTLNLEMSDLKQEFNETPFNFYERIQKLLNLQIAYFVNKESTSSRVLCEYVKNLALRVLLRGLREPIGSLMRTKNPSNLGEALSMLTNDFQFKMSKEMTPERKYVIPKYQMRFNAANPNQFQQNPRNFSPMNRLPIRPFHQNPNYFHGPQFQNLRPNPFNQLNPIHPRPIQTQKEEPMSISTRNSPPRKNPRLYQMTGQTVDSNSTENRFPDQYETTNQCVDDLEQLTLDYNLEHDSNPQINENNHFLG